MMMVSGSESKKELLLLTAAAKDFEFLFVEDKRKIYTTGATSHPTLLKEKSCRQHATWPDAPGPSYHQRLSRRRLNS